MRRTSLSFCLGLILCFSALSASGPEAAAAPDFGKVPLYFLANQGQTDGAALFYAKTPGYTLWLTREGLMFDGARMTFRGARPGAAVKPSDPADYIVSYFDGRDEADWHTGIPTSKSVVYTGLYEGIGLKVYGTEKVIEYDWIVAPGADPGLIAFGYDGACAARLNAEGDLVVETPRGTLRHRKPASYQVIDGVKVEVASSFRPLEGGTYGFELGPYDRSRELVIDPIVLVFSTYLGGTADDMACGIGVDASGAVYVMGYTDSLDFPPRMAALPRNDVFITKFSPDGKSLVYSAFFPLGHYSFILGPKPGRGSSPITGAAAPMMRDGIAMFFGMDGGDRFEVDASGAVYLAGTTGNNRFPVKNAFQPDFGGGLWDGYFLKLAPSGKSLVFSSFYGGPHEESVTCLTTDASGAVFIAGHKGPLWRPIEGPRDGAIYGDGDDLFFAKFKPDGKSRAYAKTVELSGSVNGVSGIAVDSAGALYAVGMTSSLDFPVQNAFQPHFAGMLDCFALKLAPSGRDLEYASYFGGPNFEFATGVVVDAAGSVYMTGLTEGRIRVKNAFRDSRLGNGDGFLAKINPDGKSLAYSTYFGGKSMDLPMDIILDAEGRVYIVGETNSRDFHMVKPYKPKLTGTWDGFLTIFDPTGRGLELSTYFGGDDSDLLSCLALAGDGSICMAGHTNGKKGLPLVNAFQAAYGGGYEDAFVVKLTR